MAESNITSNPKSARTGINTDSSVNQLQEGQVSYALNANVQNFDGNSINYQNEQGNTNCFSFPEGYSVIGKYTIVEDNKHIFFLANTSEGKSEIGCSIGENCIYNTIINADCLNFSIDNPILKVTHRKTNCGTEVYWPDQNGRRFLNLDELPYKRKEGTDVCDNKFTKEIDCNKLKVQPNFNIPTLEVIDIISGGDLIAGTVQFSIQYGDSGGFGYTSYYSVTNPTPIYKPNIVTPDFNYSVGKSIILSVENIDTSGIFEYFNLAVIKTVNNISSVELVGTYNIESSNMEIVYSGQNKTQIRLTIDDIFEKYPSYELAEDITSVGDVLVWKGLTSVDRMNLQKIANQIKLQWQTWRLPPGDTYAEELNATNFRGYNRDEVQAFEFVPLLANGKQLDGFHIPGREINVLDFTNPDVQPSNPDYIGGDGNPNPFWRNNNTAIVTGTESSSDVDYKGPHQYGEFGYWESSETYPCEIDVWGELAGQPIRHHKFPDINISPIFESPVPTKDADGKYTELNSDDRAIYPLGVRVDISAIESIITQSDLTPEQKESIVGFKIVRGDRSNNKSVIAKGILRNVGKYERDNTEYYFPNYPYNDLKEDPFLLKDNNAYTQECRNYTIVAGVDTQYTYTNCFTSAEDTGELLAGETAVVCSTLRPTLTDIADGTVTSNNFDTYYVVLKSAFGVDRYLDFKYQDINNVTRYVNLTASVFTRLSKRSRTLNVWPGTTPIKISSNTSKYSITKTSENIEESCYPERLKAFEDDDSKSRQVFNSPETSYGQPFLGNILKIENVIYGKGEGHFVQVKDNALYRLLTKEAQEDALDSSARLADITGTFSSAAFLSAYQTYLQIYINSITRKNYGWSYNSTLDYTYSSPVNNSKGIKQRKIDTTQYLYPGVQSVNDNLNINNYQRESSVYVKTNTELPFPSETPSLIVGTTTLIEDDSRAIASEINCSEPGENFDITSVVYYASMKNSFLNQWGQIYSYDTIDTGTQVLFDSQDTIAYIFGGDTFIGKHTFKTKLPFFIDNRVNAPNDSDIYYDEIGNVAYPEFWHSARNILYDYNNDSVGDVGDDVLRNIISIKAHNFDCPNNQLPIPDKDTAVINPDRTYYGGKMYMFAYGIPSFYCESSVNLDLRQAFNNKEGDFYPHVSSGIPDDWVQEANVSIANDNTYYYNITYSKQNKENFFSHLPANWEDDLCFTYFPQRAIYSEPSLGPKINNWLIYKPASFFDFPQNYGKLTAIDGIDNRQLLTRFENKSLVYNALYTNQTNTGGQVYLGQGLFSSNTPPLDLASDTDIGYVGSQHKFLLKIPQGYITIDSKKGQIFIVSGNSVKDLSSVEYGNHQFFVDHLPFEIIKYYPTINIDNHFKGIGLHGVFDSKYNRIIITKLDYIPLSSDLKYDGEFYLERSNGLKEVIELGDPLYFCNKSWTFSFNFNTNSWIGFHSYLPNFYIAENNFFYTGLNEGCDIDIFAAEIVETTTTTTTAAPVYDCELEGEISISDCELEGTAERIVDCDIEGEAFAIYPSTTTTTTVPPTTTTTTTLE